MDNEKAKLETGGVLESVDLKTLTEQAKQEKETGMTLEPSDAKEGQDVFNWGDEVPGDTGEPVKIQTKQEVKINEPSKEEIGGGVIVDNAPKRADGIVIGPMANDTHTTAMNDKVKEFNDLIEVGRKLALARGERPVELPTYVQIMIDKLGLDKVEFTEEEKAKLKVAKEIKVVAIDTQELAGIKIIKPKAKKMKKAIEKTFDRQFAPFVGVASGYLGKMRNLSSFEVINLMSIDEVIKDNADAVLQKCTLLYNKLKETSIGAFESFDDFIKSTAYIDIQVMMYAILTATYPGEEEILINCSNPKCVREINTKKGKQFVPKQFPHKYSNKDLMLREKIDPELVEETIHIAEASPLLEDAQKYAKKKSIVNTVQRIALGEDKRVLVDIYCPSIYEWVERVARGIKEDSFSNPTAYAPAVNLSTFIKSVLIYDDEEEGYMLSDDILDIVEVVYAMSDDKLELLGEYIRQHITVYQYSYGFKASTLTCPHCGTTFKEDVPVELEQLLFLQAQRHITNG